jgi:lysophospholipase L1-like esterase
MGISDWVAHSIQLHNPELILLQIGTNDVWQNRDLAHAPERLGHLIDLILGAKAGTYLWVSSITPLADDTKNQLVKAYNQAIPGLVSDRAGRGSAIAFVDMYAAFESHADWKTVLLGSDGIHPVDAGYEVMAESWYATIKDRLR